MRPEAELINKLQPQVLEAEQSVLGATMIDPLAMPRVLELITDDDFYRPAHRKIFRSMLELFDKNEAIDIITVTELLERKGELQDVGGATYISTLASQTPTSANVFYHARLIKEKSILRAILEATSAIGSRVYEDAAEADEMLDEAERLIFAISDKRVRSSFSNMRDMVKSSFNMIEELYGRKEMITGAPSGFTDLDEMTTGFQPGDLVIVGGRPSMGKTALSLNMASHIALEMNEPVAVFSLEMSTQLLVMRMLCSEARVDSNRVRKGIIKTEDWTKLTTAAGKLSEAPIFIDDSSNLTVIEMRAKARRLKKEHGLSLVIVDYLQLMRGRGGFERREQEISDITRSLKAMAKELQVPVVGLSQLNRGVEQRQDKRPTLADLRESGAIEQDADLILFLYRDEVYNKRSRYQGVAELIIAKQRNGPTGTVFLTFLGFCTRFENAAQSDYAIEGGSDDGYDNDDGGPF